MVHRFEAVFENGVLRPLGPLPLKDHQRVTLTIADESPVENPRYAEQRWLREHGAEYEGQWLALDGDRLLSHGPQARPVREEARRKGVDRPLMVRVPIHSDLPSAGSL
jgi:predicted DNA-binding antitoxin AbrB/MazE fold protein